MTLDFSMCFFVFFRDFDRARRDLKQRWDGEALLFLRPEEPGEMGRCGAGYSRM